MTSTRLGRSRKPYAAIRSENDLPETLRNKLKNAMADRDLCTIKFIFDVANYKSAHGRPSQVGEFRNIANLASGFLTGMTARADGAAN